jgi:hypothetical protein
MSVFVHAFCKKLNPQNQCLSAWEAGPNPVSAPPFRAPVIPHSLAPFPTPPLDIPPGWPDFPALYIYPRLVFDG